MGLGERLKELMKAKGLTQAALAKELKITTHTIRQCENSDHLPTSENSDYFPTCETALKIAAYFDVSLDYLCGLSDLKRDTSPNYRMLENYYIALNEDKRQSALMYMDFLKSKCNSEEIDKILKKHLKEGT